MLTYTLLTDREEKAALSLGFFPHGGDKGASKC